MSKPAMISNIPAKPKKQTRHKVYPTLMNSPLKWAGGKRKLVTDIAKLMPIKNRNTLIEPFVGGGSVFLNLPFSRYLLVDSNEDLINFFIHIRDHHEKLISMSKSLFLDENNIDKQYYDLRKEFNCTPAGLRRSALFLYLNRFGFNGLCRYNLKGIYNVPFGQYKKPYFPDAEIRAFSARSQTAKFLAGDFTQAFEHAQKDDIIYCDPPYTPISETANFTAYSGKGFTMSDQQRLVDCAINAQSSNITTIISNNDLPQTRVLYSKASKITKLQVNRSISCKGNIRKPCAELIAVFKGSKTVYVAK